jgi:hypothetical protein
MLAQQTGAVLLALLLQPACMQPCYAHYGKKWAICGGILWADYRLSLKAELRGRACCYTCQLVVTAVIFLFVLVYCWQRVHV